MAGPEGEELNQSPPLGDADLYALDLPLREAVAANDGAGETPVLTAFGRHWGTVAMAEEARRANRHGPELEALDGHGARRDVVEFHPAYHHFMRESVAAGLHSSTWAPDGRRAPAPAEVARAARYYMVAQVENGHMCPITMTRAAVAPLAAEPALAAAWLPKILTRHYDAAFRPQADKTGVTIGMGMTEKQGGTDVRANTSMARPAGDHYRIDGHKWFLSAPMCDAFLVLAQAQGGLTCFLMPRFTPDGVVNGLHFLRLKDKLGNRSNASSEVAFVDALAWRIGEEGRGVRTIIDMVQLTRFDCAIASAGQMRAALVQALHHARHRCVFQKRLADQPMMRQVLADLALEVEGAVALVMRLARALDRAPDDAEAAAYARLMVPVAKYWICKSAPGFVYEAMECLGGNGYVETGPLARLYREAPVNAIWEGSGNVIALDVLRAVAREPAPMRAVMTGVAAGARGLPGADAALSAIETALRGGETQARAAVEGLARLAAAAALQERGAPVAGAFAAARLNAAARLYGAAPIEPGTVQMVLDRALPA